MTEVVSAQLKEVVNVLKETSWSNFKILPVQVPAAHGQLKSRMSNIQSLDMAQRAQSEFSSATNVSRLIFLILAFLSHKIHKTVDIYTMDPRYTLPSIEFVLTMAHLDPLERRHVHRYHPCFNPAPHVQIHFHEGQRGNTAETVGFCFLLLYI